MGTQDEQKTPHANAQDMLRALKQEKAACQERGLTERVKQIDEQIKHWSDVARKAPQDPGPASEVRASDEAINAEKMLDALKSEKAQLEGRKGKEERVSAIDEQIKHYTGVLRKAKQKSAGPNGATPAATAGQQQRA